MVPELSWNLVFPIDDSVVKPDTLSVRYRGTSGAGQFELAGATSGPAGELIRSRDVIGSTIAFELDGPNGGALKIATTYPIRDTGGKVRIAVKDDYADRPNVGDLFAALFLLPEISQKDKAMAFDGIALREKTFWIDDIDTKVVRKVNGIYSLRPIQFIFASSNKDDSSQFSGATVFDYEERLNRLYAVLTNLRTWVADGVLVAVRYYLDVYRGALSFEFTVGAFMRSLLSSFLESEVPSHQSGDDILDGLQKLASSHCSGSSNCALPAEPIDKPHNYIFFGAPGTGKSYELDKLAVGTDEEPGLFAKDHVTRVTFHPDYTYSQFVGCFKPYSEPGSKEIAYEFVAGPFLDTYLKAITHPYDNYALLIEELNRANPSAVFGDVFQLLDRKKNGSSDYSVVTSKEMADCIAVYFNGLSAEEKDAIESYYDPDLDFDAFCEMSCKDLCLPPNMYIWATMNSADQGVFPMDTAFKRRWSFNYIDINEGADADIDGMKLSDIEVPCGGHTVKWNDLRVAINDFLLSDGIHVNEDKLLGPFFVAPSFLTPDNFTKVFKDKVLLYLYEDAGKTKHAKLFRADLKTYSGVCKAFEDEGTAIFGDGFVAPEPRSDEEAAADNADDSQE